MLKFKILKPEAVNICSLAFCFKSSNVLEYINIQHEI